MMNTPEGYKPVWDTLLTNDLRPEFIPEDRRSSNGRVTIAPPTGDVTITGFDYAEMKWEYKQNSGLANETAEAIEQIVASSEVTDEQALALAQFYPEWQVGIAYTVKEIVKYEEQLYRVVQDHTSQSDWLPSEASSLYALIVLGEDGIEEWTLPTGAHDSYAIGAQVRHAGQIWESLIDGNTQEPGTDERWWKLVG